MTKEEKNQIMATLGLIIKNMVDERKFVLIVQNEDESIDFATNYKDAVSIAVRFIELIEKQ